MSNKKRNKDIEQMTEEELNDFFIKKLEEDDKRRRKKELEKELEERRQMERLERGLDYFKKRFPEMFGESELDLPDGYDIPPEEMMKPPLPDYQEWRRSPVTGDLTPTQGARSGGLIKKKRKKKASGGTVKKAYNNPTRKAKYKK